MPYEPQSPSANTVSGSPRELLVSWEFPLEPNGIITSYKVYCYETDSSGSGTGDVELTPHTEESIINATTTVASGSATEAIIAGLTPYTYYNCYVTANTSVGEGNASSSVTARTDESGVCQAIIICMHNTLSSLRCILFYSPSYSSRKSKCICK